MIREDWDKAKQFAAQLAAWDSRIVEVAGMEQPAGEEENHEKKLEFICSFDLEPPGDIIGFFWIANLLARIESESLDERLAIRQPFDLGFRIGGQTFLPNGQILKTVTDQGVLWPNRVENISSGF